MINIINYECGNFISIFSILKSLNIECKITSDKDEIINSEKIILPGVGSFDHCIKSLKKFKLYNIIKECILEKKIKTLGICVGMQILTTLSEEGNEKGLNILSGQVNKLQTTTNIKVPHIGWNKISLLKNSPLLKNLKDSKFYFCHSYYVELENKSYEVASTHYGRKFCSILHKENLYGVQFHPEKSLDNGIQLLRNFALEI